MKAEQVIFLWAIVEISFKFIALSLPFLGGEDEQGQTAYILKKKKYPKGPLSRFVYLCYSRKITGYVWVFIGFAILAPAVDFYWRNANVVSSIWFLSPIPYIHPVILIPACVLYLLSLVHREDPAIDLNISETRFLLAPLWVVLCNLLLLFITQCVAEKYYWIDGVNINTYAEDMHLLRLESNLLMSVAV